MRKMELIVQLSLGHGLPIATGMAFARKNLKKRKNHCTY